jgi:hypothetical protein
MLCKYYFQFIYENVDLVGLAIFPWKFRFAVVQFRSANTGYVVTQPKLDLNTEVVIRRNIGDKYVLEYVLILLKFESFFFCKNEKHPGWIFFKKFERIFVKLSSIG